MNQSTKATILVVDDNATNLAVVCTHLTKQGFRMLTAESGPSALRRLDHISPDMLLLDVMMPEMDGFELAQRIREREDYNNQPIIFMTALDDMNSKLQGFASGGVDYITKPIQHEEMIARVRTHLEVHQLRVALRRENENKDQLIAELEAYDMTVAHDLKNPIGAIASAAETFEMMDDLTNDEAKEIIELIRMGADQAQNIIRGLLSFAQLRSGEAQRSEVDMDQLARECIETLHSLSAESGASIEIDGELPAAYGYAPWLSEVWSNLISNAIKYGGHPPIITIKGETLEKNVRYCVADNGSGLPEDRTTLFKPFSRGTSAHTEGTGLGLSIVERIIRRHEGSILAEDRPGGGAAMTFYLPKTDRNHAE
ncbi:MAG: hybrid sensor histidine kinase/response regulator [Verrucomicrobiota bacterium]